MSGSSNRGSGVGFVYFTNDDNKQTETGDFIPFSSSKPSSSHNSPSNTGNNFSPRSYSSPYKNRNNYNSPRHFHNKRGHHNRGRYSGNRSFNSPVSDNGIYQPPSSEQDSFISMGSDDSSFRSQGSYGRKYGTPNFRNRNFNKFGRDRNQPLTIDAYFHPSMLEDPWKQLEKELRDQNESFDQTSEDPEKDTSELNDSQVLDNPSMSDEEDSSEDIKEET